MTECKVGLIGRRGSNIQRAVKAALGSVTMLATVLGCSGGGSSPTPTPPPPASQAPTPTTSAGLTPVFTPGFFEPSETFEARCEAPRSGVDIEGNAFPDQPGSTLLENFWLRSWTNETYLFNTDVGDRDPADFDDRLAYFDILRTFAVTASGTPVDDFHFTIPTDEFLAQRISAPSAGYGASFAALSTTPPRDFRIRFTEPNSPASAVVNGAPNFVRGARILEIDGVDFVNGGASQAELDILNSGLFPATAGEQHEIVVQEPGAAAPRTIVLTSVDLVTQPVNRTNVIATPSGPVGYILLNTFSPFSTEQAIIDAVEEMAAANIDDLVLDLRYNGGGLLFVASQLAYMVAGEAQTAGRTFELLRFNDAAGMFNPITGQLNEATPFFSTTLGFSAPQGQALPALDLPRVFVLSTESTCSASESVVNALRGINVEVVLIGDRTCGKPFGFFPEDNCGETYFTIQFQGTNDVGFGDYTDGFVPINSTATFGVFTSGCVVADNFEGELGDADEPLLAAALQFREDGSCPAPPAVSISAGLNRATAPDAPSGAPIQSSGLSAVERLMQSNRDMTPPPPSGAQ